MRRLALAALGLLLSLAALLALAAYGYLRGWHVEAVEAARLSAALRPHDEILVPEGAGPFPAVLQFHGCGGKRAGQKAWAELFRAAGYAAVVVDSYTGRRLDWRDVCGGRRLLGSERAGDVLVSLEDARRMPFVDPERIVLAGWSHGGWSIMELLAMDPPREVPPGLRRVPELGVRGLMGVLLFYPYCGLASRAPAWRAKPSTLFLLAGADRVASSEACAGYAGALQERGVPVQLRVYAGADHSFDQIYRAGQRPVDERTTAEARADVLGFLQALAARS